MAVRKAAAQPEPEEEFEEIEEGDEDLEELEDEEPEDEAPAPKAKKTTKAAVSTAPTNGSAWLAAHVTEVTGETYDARGVRMLLRKLAKDGTLDREVGETRDRYSFTGPNDPIVKAVVKMVSSGEAKAMKQAGLEKVKAAAEAKKAKAKAEKEAAVEEAEEVEEEAPKPTRRRTAAPTKTAPAKAAPAKATTRRRAPANT
jgi:hypothetical protein